MFGLIILADSGWRMAWIMAAVLAFGGLAVVVRYLPRDVVRAGPAKKERPLVWTPALIALTIAYGIFGFGYIVTATFLVAIVRDGGGSSLFEAGVWLATGIAAAPSVAYWMPAVRRVGLANVFALGCLVEALGVAASVLVPLLSGTYHWRCVAGRHVHHGHGLRPSAGTPIDDGKPQTRACADDRRFRNRADPRPGGCLAIWRTGLEPIPGPALLRPPDCSPPPPSCWCIARPRAA